MLNVDASSNRSKVNVLFVALFDLTETYFQISTHRNFSAANAFFLTSTAESYEHLCRRGVEPGRILNVSITRAAVRRLAEPCENTRAIIKKFEAFGPTFSSIIMMSRFFRGENSEQLMQYLASTAVKIEEFLLKNRIDWVIAEPTNAVEILASVVAAKNGVRFGSIGFARLPQNRLVMFSDIEEREFHPLAKVDPPGGENWEQVARQWLLDFREAPRRPAYFAAQAVRRSTASLLRSAWKNLSLLMGGLTGGAELNYYRFSDLLALHGRARFGWLRKRIIHADAAVDLHAGRPYAVYFLHVCPERSVDVVASWFSNQIEIIRTIRRALPSEYMLYVKEHPSAVGNQSLTEYRQLREIPNMRLLQAAIDSRILMRNAALVATISGTCAFEAALLGARAVIFSHVFFKKLPLVYACDSYSALPHVMEEALASHAGGDLESGVSLISNILENSVSSGWNGSGGPLADEVVDSFCELLMRAAQCNAMNPCAAQESLP